MQPNSNPHSVKTTVEFFYNFSETLTWLVLDYFVENVVNFIETDFVSNLFCMVTQFLYHRTTVPIVGGWWLLF